MARALWTGRARPTACALPSPARPWIARFAWVLLVPLGLLAAAMVGPGRDAAAGGVVPPELAQWHAGDLWLVRADGTGRRRLTDHGDPLLRVTTPPAWAPGGRYLAYLLFEPHPQYPDDPNALGAARFLVLDLETGRERRIGDADAAADGAWPPQFTWAPDRDALLIAWPSVRYEWYDAATGRRAPADLPIWHNQRAGGGTGCGTLWHVRPDVRWLAYVHEDETLRFRELATGRERIVGTNHAVGGWIPAACHSAAWSPDGRWFAWMQHVDDGAGPVTPREDVLALRWDAAGTADTPGSADASQAVLVRSRLNQKGPTSWRPYGRRLMTAADWAAQGADAGAAETARAVEDALADPAAGAGAALFARWGDADPAGAISPDGRYVAYGLPADADAGRAAPEVWVLERSSGARWAVGAGEAAAWRGGAPWWGP